MNKTINNQSKNRSFLFLALISFVVMTISFSCEEDVNSLGSELMPDSDAIEVFYDSSLTFNSFIVQNDAIRTSNLTSYTIGIIDDPYFGKFKGEMVSQFLFEENDTNIMTYSIDSLVLLITVDSVYGNPSENIQFNLYELSNSINEDSSYYSNSETSDLYSESDKLNETFEYRGDTLLAFHLTSEFAERLKSDTSLYVDDSTFKANFKGFSVVPTLTKSTGGTVKLNLSSEDSKLVLYYAKDTTDSLSLIYSISRTNVNKFAKYEYDYSGSEVNNYLTNPENESDNLMFLQGIVGLDSRITFTNIKSWINDTINYSILNANLTIPIFSDDNIDLYHPPKQLMHYYCDEDSTKYHTEDYLNFISNLNYSFDGIKNDDNDYYHFDISRHLMNVMNGEIEDSSINLIIVNQTIYPHRVILKTGEDIKLKITYTKHKL
jgi:hypothetical protein